MLNLFSKKTEPVTVSVTAKDIAEKVGMSVRSVDLFLKRHPELLPEYQTDYPKASFRHYNPELSTVILTMKNSDSRKMEHGVRLDGKKKVAQAAIEHIKQHSNEVSLSTPPLTPMQALAQAVNAMVDMEKKMSNVEVRLGELELKSKAASDHLKALPTADDPPPQKTTRQKVNERVRAYARMSGDDHADIFKRLYHELYYRKNVNVMLRGRNQNKLYIDVVEELGLMEELFQIACSMLKVSTL